MNFTKDELFFGAMVISILWAIIYPDNFNAGNSE